MTGSPPKKIDQLRALMAAGGWAKALALAARFPDLGDHKDRIKGGHEARVHGAFYAQLGKDPKALIEDGIQALKERYGDPDKQQPEEKKDMTSPTLQKMVLKSLSEVDYGKPIGRLMRDLDIAEDDAQGKAKLKTTLAAMKKDGSISFRKSNATWKFLQPGDPAPAKRAPKQAKAQRKTKDPGSIKPVLEKIKVEAAERAKKQGRKPKQRRDHTVRVTTAQTVPASIQMIARSAEEISKRIADSVQNIDGLISTLQTIRTRISVGA